MGDTKAMPDQHIIDLEAQNLLRAALPTHWLLREYRPDYGLDYSLELFKRSPTTEKDAYPSFETLGEHVFIQLKGTRHLKIGKKAFLDRKNVETGTREYHSASEEIEVAWFGLDAVELNTVRTMGAGVPVILVVIDVTTRRIFHICLNDYVDKILLPEGKFGKQGSHTIYLPTALELDRKGRSLVPLRAYAKRPKLYTAFEKIYFQGVELQYALSPGTKGQYAAATPMFLHFARTLLSYSFWDDCEWWPPLKLHKLLLEHLVRFTVSGNGDIPADALEELAILHTSPNFVKQVVEHHGPLAVWRNLAILPRDYEELLREWWLPTPLGREMSY